LIRQQDPYSTEPTYTTPQPESPFKLYHASELDSLPSVQWLVEGEIPAKSLTALFGGSGTGKSFVTLDHALRIAQSVPVVYVAAEGETGYRDRKNAWVAHFRQKVGALYFCFQAVRMLDIAEVQTFITAIRPLSPGLVILDTLARCMLGGDENSARDMGQFIESCGLIRQQLGAAVLVVHHTSKNGNAERGSSALRGACDSMIELNNDDGLITLACSKSKDASPFPKRYLRLVTVHLSPERSSCVCYPLKRLSM
jgi:predicted ATP-dependent serine protease